MTCSMFIIDVFITDIFIIDMFINDMYINEAKSRCLQPVERGTDKKTHVRMNT